MSRTTLTSSRRNGRDPVAVATELKGLREAGLVHGVTISWSGRQAWGLKVNGRTGLAEAKP